MRHKPMGSASARVGTGESWGSWHEEAEVEWEVMSSLSAVEIEEAAPFHLDGYTSLAALEMQWQWKHTAGI